MGRGIALTMARAGISTLLFDLNPQALALAKQEHEKELAKSVEKGKINEAEKAKTLALIRYTPELEECLAELFIEAIVAVSYTHLTLPTNREV